MTVLTQEKVLSKVERFLKKAKMSPTRFGYKAVDDPKFVFDMRNKRRTPKLETIKKIDDFMDNHKIQSHPQ